MHASRTCETSSSFPIRLQELISTALLETVSASDPELVLQYENLVVASKYLPGGDEEVIVGVTGGGKGVEFDNISQADVIIEYSSDGAVSTVQVSHIYPLFFFAYLCNF